MWRELATLSPCEILPRIEDAKDIGIYGEVNKLSCYYRKNRKKEIIK